MNNLTGKRVGARNRVPEFRENVEAARADARAALAASEVEQVALTEDLAYTLPAGVGPNRVHSVVFTQDATGGHTVTFGGNPVTVDTTADASTLVEVWPNGEVAYPVAAPLSSTFAAAGISLPRALGGGADDTPAIQAALDAAVALMLSPRVTGLPGETYQTSGLVIHSGTTLDMTGCAIERMVGAGVTLRNAAYGGSGQRDHDITVIGGEWRRMSSRTGSTRRAGLLGVRGLLCVRRWCNWLRCLRTR